MNVALSFAGRKSRPKPAAGDVKTSRYGVFVRQQATCDGCSVVSRGHPVYEWVRTGDAPPEFSGRPVIKYRLKV